MTKPVVHGTQRRILMAVVLGDDYSKSTKYDTVKSRLQVQEIGRMFPAYIVVAL